MSLKYLSIAALCGGLLSTALSNIPILNLVNCLLCAGFWGGAVAAVWLYKRFTGTLTLGQAVVVGTLAGVVAGIFGFLLSIFGLAGASALLTTYRQFVDPKAMAEIETTLSGPMTWLFDLTGAFTNIVLGAIGGLIGGAIFKTRPQS